MTLGSGALSIQRATNERTNEATGETANCHVTERTVSPISRCQQSSNQRGRNVASIRSIVPGPPCNSTRLRPEPEPLTRLLSLSLSLFLFLYAQLPLYVSFYPDRSFVRCVSVQRSRNSYRYLIIPLAAAALARVRPLARQELCLDRPSIVRYCESCVMRIATWLRDGLRASWLPGNPIGSRLRLVFQDLLALSRSPIVRQSRVFRGESKWNKLEYQSVRGRSKRRGKAKKDCTLWNWKCRK